MRLVGQPTRNAGPHPVVQSLTHTVSNVPVGMLHGTTVKGTYSLFLKLDSDDPPPPGVLTHNEHVAMKCVVPKAEKSRPVVVGAHFESHPPCGAHLEAPPWRTASRPSRRRSTS